MSEKRRKLDFESRGHLKDVQFRGDRVLDIDDPDVWMSPLRSGSSEVASKMTQTFKERHLLLRVSSVVRDRLRRKGD